MSRTRSQTIGNQTSSLRSSRPGYHRKPEASRGETVRKMGIHVTGIPLTPKIDRMEKFMMGDKAPHRRTGCDAEFHLHYCQWFSGNETTGEGVYTCAEGVDLKEISDKMNGIRIDKKHDPIQTCVLPICFNCYFPLDCEDTPGHLPKGNLEKASTLNKHVCELCLPSPIHCCCCDTILPDDESQTGYRRSSSEAYACRSCWNDSSLQEKWRYNEENNLVTAKSSSYVEELYLSDEAIEREKALMGGVPPEPCEDITPFSDAFRIKDLIDPNSRDYWPFGMNAQRYLGHKELMRFNNPMEETPDESWREIEVTEDVLSTYAKDIQSAYERYNYSNEDRGTLPSEIVAAECKYRLVDQCHGFTCDSPVCQAVFQHQQELDSGAFAALVATGIPIFTTRPGNIHGTAREAGFGHERCIACVSKALPDYHEIHKTYYTNSVKISRVTTDRKL
jgi:hypothetical protein